MPKRLIVNADDYGLAPVISDGILRAYREGIVTSTTAMMNMPSAAAAVGVARRECPGLGLGVHLILTAGQPVLPPDAVPSIVALGDAGSFPSRETLLARAAELRLAEIEAEWRAQIDRFLNAAGQPPTHLDSHHHASYFTPELFGLMLQLAREHGAAIRMPLTTLAIATAVLSVPAGSPQVGAALSAIQAVLNSPRAAGIPRPDYFEPRFYADGATADSLHQLLSELPEGTSEIMCHPALDHPDLAQASSYGAPRARELAALTQPGLRTRLQAAGIQLISFGHLSP